MSTVKILSSGNAQVRVTHRLLGKPYYATFDTPEQAAAYGEHLDRLLAQGIVPAALLERPKVEQAAWSLTRCMLEYVKENPVPVSDSKLLDTIRPQLAKSMSVHLNYDWAEAWVREMKRVHNLAPSTIRHRHGALARCFDWMVRKHPEVMVQNPLRLLKRGFATYTDDDRAVLTSLGKAVKVDTERDRRLEDGEEARILAVLRERPDERAFFLTALESAMRMRECYTLELPQVAIPKRTIYLDRTKNGHKRQVPMSSTLVGHLSEYIAMRADQIRSRGGRLFPFWSGDLSVRNLDATTSAMSKIYQDIFALAGNVDLHFQDLRHEATCRLFERTTLSDTLIAKITGHRDPRQLKRYASLRGSDLAQHLW
jgi:integrase